MTRLQIYNSSSPKACRCLLHGQMAALSPANPPCLAARLLDRRLKGAKQSLSSVSRTPVKASALGGTVCSAAATVEVQRLADLELCNVLNQGLIRPEVPEGTKATIFAIFDEHKKLQYVGFSKDCRNSLRTVFTRRPQKTFYYKALHLPSLDQQAMLDIRNAWFEEVGGAPNGNRLAIERNQWQLPVSSGAISDRGKQQAAENEAIMLRTMFASRGCKEHFVPDPKLLSEGKVDFLPAEALSAEDQERQQAAVSARSQAIRNVVAVIDGNQADFEIFVDASYKTKGGYIFDVRVTYEERETPHRVIIGKEYYEDFKLQPEQVLDRAFAYLLAKKVQRQTEGLMMNGEFPINYFSISTIEQYFDDFATAFLDTGIELRADDKFWRFNRIHSYGHQAAKQMAEARTTAA